jgi:hypothetical protein
VNPQKVYRDIQIKELEDRIHQQYLILLLIGIFFLLTSILLFVRPGTSLWKPIFYAVICVVYFGYSYVYLHNPQRRFQILRLLFYFYVTHTGIELVVNITIILIEPGQLGRDVWTKGKGLIFAWIYLAIQFLYPVLRILWIGYFVWAQRQFTRIEILKNQN